MKIVFTQSENSLEIPVSGASEVKLYAVPASYSDDGYAASVWGAQDLEPVPGCAGDELLLLAHLRVEQGQDGEAVLQEVYCNEGVSYAQA